VHDEESATRHNENLAVDSGCGRLCAEKEKKGEKTRHAPHVAAREEKEDETLRSVLKPVALRL